MCIDRLVMIREWEIQIDNPSCLMVDQWLTTELKLPLILTNHNWLVVFNIFYNSWLCPVVIRHHQDSSSIANQWICHCSDRKTQRPTQRQKSDKPSAAEAWFASASGRSSERWSLGNCSWVEVNQRPWIPWVSSLGELAVLVDICRYNMIG